MPRYNYECLECGCNLQVTHRMSERLRECTECGEEALERIPFLLTVPKKVEQKVGVEVETFIKTAREEIEIEKERLKDRKVR